MVRSREPGHVRADFGHDDLRNDNADTRDLIEAGSPSSRKGPSAHRSWPTPSRCPNRCLDPGEHGPQEEPQSRCRPRDRAAGVSIEVGSTRRARGPGSSSTPAPERGSSAKPIGALDSGRQPRPRVERVSRVVPSALVGGHGFRGEVPEPARFAGVLGVKPAAADKREVPLGATGGREHLLPAGQVGAGDRLVDDADVSEPLPGRQCVSTTSERVPRAPVPAEVHVVPSGTVP